MIVPPQWESYVRDAEDGQVADARMRLAQTARELRPGGDCESVVGVGRPEESLIGIARDGRVGLIVMGLANTHGLWARRPGSIAYGVMRAAGVPVLVVPVPTAASA